MNKKFVLALMLASGMAFAQSGGSSPGSSDQQQPSTQQPSTQPQQPQTPAGAGQGSLTGCLKGSDGNWVLVAEGQSTPITGDSSTLAPHNGHQVQVKGSQASDGSFQVTEVVMIAETCTKQDASASAGAAAGAVTGAAGDAAQATKSAASEAASAAQGATTPQTQTATPQTQPEQSAGADQAAAKKMPQTASPLPLLGLVGFASLVSGLITLRK